MKRNENCEYSLKILRKYVGLLCKKEVSLFKKENKTYNLIILYTHKTTLLFLFYYCFVIVLQ